jgi:hypothetical protein
VPASAASASARHAGWLASAQDALEWGAQAARVAMGQASQVDPSIGANVTPGEAADVPAAPSPTDVLPAPASTPVEAVADLPVEPPIAADVGTAEAPLLEVAPTSPVSATRRGRPPLLRSAIGGPPPWPREAQHVDSDGTRSVDCRGTRRLRGGARRTATRLGEQRPYPQAVQPQ